MVDDVFLEGTQCFILLALPFDSGVSTSLLPDGDDTEYLVTSPLEGMLGSLFMTDNGDASPLLTLTPLPFFIVFKGSIAIFNNLINPDSW